MVLESLLGPKKAIQKPWDLFFLGLLYASIGTFLGLWVFKNQASLVLVFLTVVAAVPLMYKTIRREEKFDTRKKTPKWLLKHHSKVLAAFIFLFFGFVIAFTLWNLFLPEKLVQSTFSSQIETIRNINSRAVGSLGVSSDVSIDASISNSSNIFMQIISNNLKVLLFCIFFSFFYGAGAIFILTWNASVIATAIGSFIRSNLADIAAKTGFSKIATYFGVFSLGLLRYSIHGIPEILAYFAAGLAGGIISVAVIRHDFGSASFKKILAESTNLIVLSIILVIIAGVLEVWVTPLFF